MADRARRKQIQLLYSFDRLAAQKLSQVYRLLVPREHSIPEKRQSVFERSSRA